MAIPAELNYPNEKEFIQRFLIPLFQRLGFSPVNYHGSWELGKDLILAEFDRLGHVRYHALQAKYVDSIGLGDTRSLIDDCEQAFGSPFNHPHTGAEERISTFYVANGGSVSDAATKSFFERLTPKFGANVRLLDGPALIVLDRGIAYQRAETVGTALSGLLMELEYNKRITDLISQGIQSRMAGSGVFPEVRLKLDAVAAYLSRPVLASRLPQGMAFSYWEFAHRCGSSLDNAMQTGFYSKQASDDMVGEALNSLKQAQRLATQIEAIIRQALTELGPLSGM